MAKKKVKKSKRKQKKNDSAVPMKLARGPGIALMVIGLLLWAVMPEQAILGIVIIILGLIYTFGPWLYHLKK